MTSISIISSLLHSCRTCLPSSEDSSGNNLSPERDVSIQDEKKEKRLITKLDGQGVVLKSLASGHTKTYLSLHYTQSLLYCIQGKFCPCLIFVHFTVIRNRQIQSWSNINSFGLIHKWIESISNAPGQK